MAVIPALRDGWTALRENPVLLVAGFAFAAVSHLADVGEQFGPPVAEFVVGPVAFLATPFVIGGLLGMALEALEDTETSLRRFVAAGRTYYVRVLVGTVLFVAAIFVAVSATFPLTGAGFLGLYAAGGIGAEPSVWVAAGFLAVTLLGVLVTVFFLQFFGAAIVVEDEDGVGALGRSARVVRANLASVVGFSVLWIAATNLLIPDVLLLEVVTEYELVRYVPVGDDLLRAAALPVGLAVATLVFTYLYVVQTAYYCRLVGRLPSRDSAGTGDAGTGASAGAGDWPSESAVRSVDGAEDSTDALERGNAYADRA